MHVNSFMPYVLYIFAIFTLTVAKQLSDSIVFEFRYDGDWNFILLLIKVRRTYIL